jgi:prepilin-type N-terminal cleavage/methylation domain-containing protein
MTRRQTSPSTAASTQPRPYRRGGSAASGFTLIEVVLALTIFALMGAILYGAFSLGHGAAEKSEAHSTRQQKRRVVAELLGNYIRSSYPYRASAQDQTIYFVGESDSVTFVSAYSQAMGGRGLAKIRLAGENDSNGRGTLKLDETAPVRVSTEGGGAGQSHSLVLQTDLGALRFAYLDPQAELETWEERWDGGERRILPRALRLSYRDESGQETHWIFPLMMSVLAP